MGIQDTSGQLVYDVTNVDSSKAQRVHSKHIFLYLDRRDGFDVSDEILEHSGWTGARYETFDRLLGIHQDANGQTVIRVFWDGLPYQRDWKWNSVTELHEDVPELMAQFLQSFKLGKKKKLADCLQGLLHPSIWGTENSQMSWGHWKMWSSNDTSNGGSTNMKYCTVTTGSILLTYEIILFDIAY